jgi:integrase
MARIADFLKSIAHDGTRVSYGSAVNKFFSFIYGFTTYQKRQVKELMNKQRIVLENLADRYFIEERDYAKDLRDFNQWYAKDHTPTSCQHYSSIIREFFLFHNINLTEKEIRTIRKKVKRGRAVTEDHYLTKEDLKKILMHADLKLKSIILFQVSSGLRPGEVLNLDLDDVKIFDDYARILIRAEKSKNHTQRVTFCSKEAVEYLRAWLSVRDDYIEKVLKKTRGQFQVNKSMIKNHVFPFSDVNYRNMMKRALVKADLYKLDPVTQRASIHPHLFRKFFETQLYRVINPKVIEKLVGHESELSRAYIKYNEEDLLKEYKKGEYAITILSDVSEELEKTKDEMKDTKDKVRDMQLENLMMKSKLQDFDKLRERLEKMEKILTEYDENILSMASQIYKDDKGKIHIKSDDELLKRFGFERDISNKKKGVRK